MVHWLVMVKSEIKLQKLQRQNVPRNDRLVAPRSERSTTDVFYLKIQTTRERRVPTSVQAENPRTSPSERTLSVISGPL